ncbi:testis-expressed protein 10 homolog [Strongylocentrotus purpuratus]|uniref:Pre-rRNA-processing protein Ipi1 N-terminal domain-containing protein n=1 Tax=Strongylocentrotus purpuratus TaxID=7668 RepID=A0A7M7NIQ3_STRPU|nr:testis-expressed protein 10 homolog [Strongylocentrotus purpuratus]
MVKGSRKNKEKKKDFQKVKLKVGKQLAKADNFTDTSFKSRAIHIREQLKTSDKDGGEPVTSRKQNIQELLCQANHYNASIRSSAIQGTKTLLTTNPSLIPEHLPTLIPSISTAMTDKEGVVRQAGVALLRVIMDTLASHQMAPFFPTVCMHLCCAMTHIQEDVQLDSLVVMETILQHYPGLIAPHCKELLTNFINLISQQRNKLGSSSSLKVNPSGKLAGQKWRLKVLQMLQKFLDVMRKSKEKEHLPERGEMSQTIKVDSTGAKPTYAPILKANGAFSGRPKPFILRTDQSVSNLGIDFLSDPEAILGMARTLIPLLLQCWGEVNLPAKGQGQGESGVTLGQKEEETLGCVVAILQTLWSLLQRACDEKGNDSALDEMKKTYQRKISQQFHQGFPYSLHHAHTTTTTPRRGSSKPPAGSSHGSATPINLSACNLVLSILVVEGNKPRPWMGMVREFIEDALREEDDGEYPLGQEEQEVLMDVVQKMMNKPGDDETSISLEDALFVYYARAHPLSQQKLRALKTLRSICLDRARPDDDNISEKLPAFFDSLGELIDEARSSPLGISEEALHTLLVAASRGHIQAIQCMEKHLPQWLSPDNAVMECLDQSTQRRLLECLYHLPSLDSSLMKQLMRYCCKTNSDVHFPLYLLANRCFDNVFGTSRKPPLSHSAFMDFVYTVSMGTSPEDLSSLLNKIESSDESSNHALRIALHPFYHIVHGKREVELLHRANAVNKIAMQVYRRHPDPEVAIAGVLAHIQDTLKSFNCLPICTVLSILEHTAMLQRYHTQSASSSSSVLQSMSSSRETLDSIDGMIGSLAFLLLYDAAVRNVADLAGREEEYAVELWKQAVDCVTNFGDGSVGSLINCALTACKDHSDDRQVAKVIVRLLQTGSVKRRMQIHSGKLLALVQLIEDNLAAPSDSRWFAELKYEVSLLAKEIQLDR